MNKLRRLGPMIRENSIPSSFSRQDLSVFTSLKIRHSYFTLLSFEKWTPPFCIGCNGNVTIEPLLTNCAEYTHMRTKHYTISTLEETLTVKNCKHVIAFFKEIQQYPYRWNLFISLRSPTAVEQIIYLVALSFLSSLAF